jgi:hypothetical protein
MLEQQKQETDDDETRSAINKYFGLQWLLTKLARARRTATAERMMLGLELKSDDGDQVIERLLADGCQV